MSDESPNADAMEAMRLRIREADVAAVRADLAFATGRFREYFEDQGHDAEERIEASYAEFFDTDADGGGGGEGGGSEPGDGISEDGGDSASEQPAESISTPTGGQPPPADGGD